MERRTGIILAIRLRAVPHSQERRVNRHRDRSRAPQNRISMLFSISRATLLITDDQT